MDIQSLKTIKVKETEYYIRKNNALRRFHLMLVNTESKIEDNININIFINNSLNSDGLMTYIYESYKYINKIVQIYIYKNNELIKFLFPIKFDNVFNIDIINDYLYYCMEQQINNGTIDDIYEYIYNLNLDYEKCKIYF